MRRLQLTVRKVCRELQLPTDIVRLVLSNASSLQFDGDPEEVFAYGNNGVAPLKFISGSSKGMQVN